jgi:hypothetical protein
MMALLENRAGAAFDMVLPYFAVRLAVQTRQQYVQLLRGIVLIAAPLGVAGLAECLTGWNPIRFLRVYETADAGTVYYTAAERFGLIRATVGFSHSTARPVLPCSAGPVPAKRNTRRRSPIGLRHGVGSACVQRSCLAAVLALRSLAFSVYQHWKAATAAPLRIVEIISNRHFYDVLGDFHFFTEAWYRSR